MKNRILIVEDAEVNRELLIDLLTASGFEVATAENGVDALECVSESAPDLILMDMMMPVMDGFEATRRLKSNPRTAPIPVVGLTALAMPGDAEKCKAAGCDDYVTKPIDVMALPGRIHALLKRAAK